MFLDHYQSCTVPSFPTYVCVARSHSLSMQGQAQSGSQMFFQHCLNPAVGESALLFHFHVYSLSCEPPLSCLTSFMMMSLMSAFYTSVNPCGLPSFWLPAFFSTGGLPLHASLVLYGFIASMSSMVSVIVAVGIVGRTLLTSESICSESCSWLGGYLEFGHTHFFHPSRNICHFRRRGIIQFIYTALLHQCWTIMFILLTVTHCSLWVSSCNSSCLLLMLF